MRSVHVGAHLDYCQAIGGYGTQKPRQGHPLKWVVRRVDGMNVWVAKVKKGEEESDIRDWAIISVRPDERWWRSWIFSKRKQAPAVWVRESYSQVQKYTCICKQRSSQENSTATSLQLHHGQDPCQIGKHQLSIPQAPGSTQTRTRVGVLPKWFVMGHLGWVRWETRGMYM